MPPGDSPALTAFQGCAVPRQLAAQFVEVLSSRILLTGGAGFSAPATLIGQELLVTEFPLLTGGGQTVAVIDTGIDYTHPLLGGGFGPGFKVVGGYDFVDNDTNPMDSFGHGTAIAALIAGESFEMNGTRYQGVAPDASLVALRVAADTSETPNSRIRQALQWVLDNRQQFGITVANISFGYGKYESAPVDGQFALLLANLAEAGVIVVASSGNAGINSGWGIRYPAADPNAISVGAVDAFDVISEFTERGKLLDVLAPGEGIVAPWLAGQTRQVSGTSYAAPIVAGAVALIKQINPSITLNETRSILRAGSQDNLDGDDEFGVVTQLRFPRINLPAVVRLTQSRLPADPTLPDPWPAARNNSIAFDRDGILHAAFYDASERTLKYATRAPSGEWSAPMIVDSEDGDFGRYLSLALDSVGRPGIAYFDAAAGDLRYARLVEGQFVVEVVDSRQSVGLYASTKFDAENRPAIAYYHRTKGDLRFARREGAGWKVDDIDRHSNDRGRSVSLAVNSFGRFSTAYEDSTSGKLKFAVQTSNGWVIDTIDNDTSGVSYISAAYDRNDRLAVSYYDATPADLKFASTDDPLNPRWRVVTIARKGAVGLFSQLAIDADNNPAILYYSRRDDALLLARGTITRMTATRLQVGGGRFTSLAIEPETGGVQYSWYSASQNTLKLSMTGL